MRLLYAEYLIQSVCGGRRVPVSGEDELQPLRVQILSGKRREERIGEVPLTIRFNSHSEYASLGEQNGWCPKVRSRLRAGIIQLDTCRGGSVTLGRWRRKK